MASDRRSTPCAILNSAYTGQIARVDINPAGNYIARHLCFAPDPDELAVLGRTGKEFLIFIERTKNTVVHRQFKQQAANSPLRFIAQNRSGKTTKIVQFAATEASPTNRSVAAACAISSGAHPGISVP
jgi:hypothetical protein